MLNTKTIISSQQLYEHGLISAIDWHFAQLMQTLANNADDYLVLGAALASAEIRAGHSCAELSQLTGQAPGLSQLEPEHILALQDLCYPELKPWLQALKDTSVVGAAGEFYPLILDGTRLYLQRYWLYEQHIAQSLYQRAKLPLPGFDSGSLAADIQTLFPATNEIDWQQLAALTAVLQNLSIISGGPGTGKTTTVVKVLALLLGQNPELRIALTAPTGKAAMRLQSSIQAAKQQLPTELAALIPQQSNTLHRLLGVQKHSPHFKHNAEHPLALDVLLVDEVSMIDLALMSKLLDALPLESRLILLGDKDQLSSVEAGAVLESICSAGGTIGFSAAMVAQMQSLLPANQAPVPCVDKALTLQDQVVYLQKSYRFSADSALGRFALAVNQGDSQAALAQLNAEDAGVVCHHKQTLNDLSEVLIAGFSPYLHTSDIAEQLAYLQEFKVLCAYRQGETGVVQVNRFIRQLLQEQGLIRQQGRWYAGQPVLITQNDYQHQLFNGDTGIVAPIPDAPQRLGAFFPDDKGGLRYLSPSRLPAHEEAYAMTIHKSQGSEFKQVLMVLPKQAHPMLDRALLYTGLTRAREQVRLLANHGVLKQMIEQRTPRYGGLTETLIHFSDKA